MFALLLGLNILLIPPSKLTVVQTAPTLLPALLPICTCESGQGTGQPQQFDIETGDVLHGKIDKDDTGSCQINARYHLKKSVELGYDIYTEAGNINYANWLYLKEGVKPWRASSSCSHAS